jgi:hypothetical protein
MLPLIQERWLLEDLKLYERSSHANARGLSRGPPFSIPMFRALASAYDLTALQREGGEVGGERQRQAETPAALSPLRGGGPCMSFAWLFRDIGQGPIATIAIGFAKGICQTKRPPALGGNVAIAFRGWKAHVDPRAH